MGVAMARSGQTDDAKSEECTDQLIDELIECSTVALEAVLDSRRGKRYELLAPSPREALLAFLGHPADDRPMWQDLAIDLRGHMMQEEGLIEGAFAH